jgi:hypothetical protein
MDNTIKASEVLFEVLAKIKNVENLLKVQSFQHKILIQRIDKLTKEIMGVEESNVPKEIIDPNIGRASRVEATEEPPMPKERKQTDVATDEGFSFKSKTLDAAEQVSTRTFPVTQIVSYNKAPIPMGDIIVTSDAGENMKTTQTNNKGRWQAVLPVGNYIVNAKWKINEEAFEFTQSFEVPETATSIITLQMPKAVKKTKI